MLRFFISAFICVDLWLLLIRVWQRDLHRVHEVGDEVTRLLWGEGLQQALGHHGELAEADLRDLGALKGRGFVGRADGHRAVVLLLDDAGKDAAHLQFGGGGRGLWVL